MLRSCRLVAVGVTKKLLRRPDSTLVRHRPWRGDLFGLGNVGRPSSFTPLSVASISSSSGQNNDDNIFNMGDNQSDFEGAENLASWDVIATKLLRVFRVIQEKLNKADSNEHMFQLLHSTLALIQLMKQLLERRDEDRISYYKQSGRAGTPADLEGLQEGFELANAAYETSTDVLRETLNQYGYHLLKHNATILSGALSNYVAINKNTKTVLVGVKGTSSFEEMLTDCCGFSVQKVLEDGTTITCHEGIYISSKALADDLQEFVEELVIPSGYKLQVLGHSLGAAGAALTTLILKSRIPALNEKVKVLAFASPPILDLVNARRCSTFVTTIVNNADMIPRSSVGTLAVTLDILDEISDRLKALGLDGTTAESYISFHLKLLEGSQGDLLMEAREMLNLLERASTNNDQEDPNHLFCAGKMIIMFDESRTDDGLGAIDFVVAPDGSAEVLRTLEWNQRMITDHTSASYQASLEDLSDLIH